MNFKTRESDWVNGFLAVGKFKRRKIWEEGMSVPRGRPRMMVSIYIFWCGQEHGRRTREVITYCEHAKYGLVWGGLLKCQKWEGRIVMSGILLNVVP